MKTIEVSYGISRRNHTCASSETVGQVIADPNNRIVLGYGDNVQALIGGVVVSSDVVVPDGATVNLENRANQKAV